MTTVCISISPFVNVKLLNISDEGCDIPTFRSVTTSYTSKETSGIFLWDICSRVSFKSYISCSSFSIKPDFCGFMCSHRSLLCSYLQTDGV